MGIEKLDANFKKEELNQSDNKTAYTIPCEKFDLYGVYYDENIKQFVRMDNEISKRVSNGVYALSKYTSGGRLRFSTDSSVIGISVKYNSLNHMPHMPLTGSSGFTLVEKIDGKYKNVGTFRPEAHEKNGYTGEIKVKESGRHEYILYFPLYNSVSELQIFLDSNATLFEPEKYRDIAPILYYGASIDQGGCASRPDCSYTAMISKWNDIDFINLCFSGNCLGEPLLAEYLREIECSLFFMAYDGNAPTVEYFKDTHYPFYKAFREVQKDVPIVFMSVPCFDNNPKFLAQRREIILETCAKARENGDNNVYFLDGETLFGERDREICTVEGVHPNDLGFYRIAEGIAKLYKELGFMD